MSASCPEPPFRYRVKQLNLDDATKLIFEKINEPDPYWPDKPELVVLVDSTIERDWGWVFYYNSALFLESGNISDALAGNSPYIVNRSTGEIQVTGTAHPIEYYIDKYEQDLKQSE